MSRLDLREEQQQSVTDSRSDVTHNHNHWFEQQKGFNSLFPTVCCLLTLVGVELSTVLSDEAARPSED